MLDLSVTIQDGPLVAQRLTELANAARVFGEAKTSITSDAPYLGFVVGGTRPHDIYPRDKQALYWPGANHPVTHVHHPGTRPNDFLQKAVDDSKDAVEAFVVGQLEMVAVGGGSNYTQIMPGAAKIILKAAQQDAPVRTGNLRRSLYVS